jgi:subtilase family serine protease
MRNNIAWVACAAVLCTVVAGTLAPAAPVVAGTLAPAVPVEATSARGASTGGAPAATLMPAAGAPGVFLPGIRGFTAGDGPPTSAECLASYGIPCYSPPQIEQAYDLPPLYARGLTGQGRTIVIVDPYGSPTIRHDLDVFDDAFGLPGPPSLRILQPIGPVPPFNPDNQALVAAAGETTGDVELAHEIAPGANIVIVEFPVTATTVDGKYTQAMTAENDVISQNIGDVFSQSFGAPEPDLGGAAAIQQLRFAYVNAYAHHMTMLAASGDSGASGPTLTGTSFDQRVVYWPASDPLVTGVGGTELHLDAAGNRTSPDTAWNDNGNPAVQKVTGIEYLWASGGGQSSVFSRPRYQDSVRQVTGDTRGVPDIAMSAAFSGAVLIYESFTGAPGVWGPGGGTSVASPLLSGVIAIADQYAHARLGLINPALYQLEQEHAPGIVDITQGDNTVTFTLNGTTYTVTGYPATPGYDLVTGVGTIDAARFVPELATTTLHPTP